MEGYIHLIFKLYIELLLAAESQFVDHKNGYAIARHSRRNVGLCMLLAGTTTAGLLFAVLYFGSRVYLGMTMLSVLPAYLMVGTAAAMYERIAFDEDCIIARQLFRHTRVIRVHDVTAVVYRKRAREFKLLLRNDRVLRISFFLRGRGALLDLLRSRGVAVEAMA